MSLPYFKINTVLNNWASNTPSILDFTVENVLVAVSLNNTYYDKVYRFLMSKVGFELIAKKILLCPSNHKCDEFLLDEPIEEEYFDCNCGENDFEPENFILAFSFTEDYKSEALKKKMSSLPIYQLV